MKPNYCSVKAILLSQVTLARAPSGSGHALIGSRRSPY